MHSKMKVLKFYGEYFNDTSKIEVSLIFVYTELICNLTFWYKKMQFLKYS